MRQPFLQVAVRRPDNDELRELLLQSGGDVDLPRYAAQRVFRRLVAVERREHRRPLRVRVVVRTAAADAHPADAEPLEQREHLTALAKRLVDAIVVVDHAEAWGSPCVSSNRLADTVGAPRIPDQIEHRDTDENARANV